MSTESESLEPLEPSARHVPIMAPETPKTPSSFDEPLGFPLSKSSELLMYPSMNGPESPSDVSPLPLSFSDDVTSSPSPPLFLSSSSEKEGSVSPNLKPFSNGDKMQCIWSGDDKPRLFQSS